MRRQLAFLVLCSGVTVLSSGWDEELSSRRNSARRRPRSINGPTLRRRSCGNRRRTAGNRGSCRGQRQAIDAVGALASDARTRAVTAP